eukprot:Sdes_comp20170_c0_seq6m13347
MQKRRKVDKKGIHTKGSTQDHSCEESNLENVSIDGHDQTNCGNVTTPTMTPNRPRAAKSGNDHSIPNNSHSGSTGNNRNPSLEKLKRKWKPYSQLTWQEKKELEDRDDLRSGTKASQGLPLVPNRRFLKRRAIRIQDFRPAAPKNTTQFLLEEHQGASPEVTVDVVSLEADESGDSLPGES